MAYGAALEMRYGATHRGFKSRPLRQRFADGRIERDGGRDGRPCYDRRAVLGGELAVPCTCNPLQQG